LQQITKCLACDWAKDHIRVNCVAPFWTRIPVKFAQQMLSNPEFVADLEDCIPLKRVAETHEITGVIAFLCMPVSSFTTGQTICIDGGLTAHGFTPKSFLGA